MNQQQLEKQVLAKKNILNPNEPISSLRQFIKIRPVGIRKIQIVNEDLKNFQFIISKFALAQVNQLVQKLTESESEILLDYLHRFMQFIGQQQTGSSGNALIIEEEIVKRWGPGIVLQATARNDTVCWRTRNFN